eukprot:3927584-Amphidinium_carterae.4
MSSIAWKSSSILGRGGLVNPALLTLPINIVAHAYSELPQSYLQSVTHTHFPMHKPLGISP